MTTHWFRFGIVFAWMVFWLYFFNNQNQSGAIVAGALGFLVIVAFTIPTWMGWSISRKPKKDAFNQTFSKPDSTEVTKEPVPALVDQAVKRERIHYLADEVVSGYWNKVDRGEWEDERGN